MSANIDFERIPFTEIGLEDKFKPLGEMSFREIAGSVVYIKGAKTSINTGLEKENPDYPDYVAYGYIDCECGLSLHVLCSARMVDGYIEYLHDFEDRALILRSGGLETVECAQVIDSALPEFAERIAFIRSGYDMDDPQLTELRDIRMLDPFRHPQYPDDIQALLFKEGMDGIEQVWLKTCSTNEDYGILARLLNEPHADFGVHEGDLLPVGFAEGENGPICVAIPEPQVPDIGSQPIDASRPHRESYIAYSVEGAPVLTSEEYQTEYDDEIADCFDAVIQAEAPIEETLLCNRVRETSGIGRSGKNIQARSLEMLKKPDGFVFASGVELADGERVTEGFYAEDPEIVTASVSLEKLEQVIGFFIVAQEKEPVNFFLELPCTADEEDDLRENDEGPLHYGVYYSEPLDGDIAIGLMHRYCDILLNSGLITFGFFCNETESQITIDKYKIVTIIGLDPDTVDRIFSLADVPNVKPITAWDTISEKTPGKNYLVEVNGKSIYDHLSQMKDDFGLELDRYESEEGNAVRVDPSAGGIDGDGRTCSGGGC